MDVRKSEVLLRRGWILWIVKNSSGETSSDKLIQKILFKAAYEVEIDELHDELRLLAKRGYLEVSDPELGTPFEMLVVELTNKGRQLLFGDLEDEAVSFSHKD